MIRNYLKISLRHLKNHKLFSAINVLGLAVGLACTFLIALFIYHELSFDKYHPGAERTFRLSMEFDDGLTYWASNTYFLIPLLKETYPEIEAGARIMVRPAPVQRGQEAFGENGFLLADPEIFELFSFDWILGDPSRALADPFTLVLTETTAKKYFGDENPIGQTLLVNNGSLMTVMGVIADLPENTHLEADIFTSMETGVAIYGENEISGGFDFHSYVRFAEDANLENLAARLTQSLMSRMTVNFQGRTRVVAVPLPEVHFNPFSNEISARPGSMSLVYSISAIAVGILLIACINFMNLSTARSSQRAVEVGMRKSIGARRGQLIRQFVGESVLLSFLSMIVAAGLVELLLPAFSNFVGYDMSIEFFREPVIVLSLVGLSLVIGVVAGSYPAFYLSSFEPAKVLKGDSTRGKAGILFRNLLVIGQFSISIALIISTAVIYSQMYFARNIDLGYNREQVVVLAGSTTEYLGGQWETMKQVLLSHPEITHVTASETVPGPLFGNPAWFLRHEGGVQPADMGFMSVDFGFFETYDVALVAGRFFDPALTTDRMRFAQDEGPGAAYILNESGVRQLGWTPAEAIGKWIEFGENGGLRGPLIGVVEDVYFQSLRSPRNPTLYFVGRSQFNSPVFSFNFASIRITGNNLEQTLAFIDATWNSFMPGQPVSRSFLDQNFEAMYQREDQQGELLTWFSLLAIIIACMGLFGLAAFNAERRTKEIGVRKVMGGSVWSIVLLLTNDFSKLVLISNVIAWPLAYVAMERWLENFAYRIDLTPLIFIGSGAIALCIAWVTVGGTAAKAASAKPVLALRYE